MNIIFYSTTDPNKKVTKTLTDETQKTGKLIEGCDISDPEITVGFCPIAFNYAYIPDFGRYYFCEPPENLYNNIWKVKMHVDVLSSFDADIRGSKAVVAKNEHSFNLYINDPEYKCQQNDIIIYRNLSGSFDEHDSCFVLSIYGDKEYVS